MIAIQIISKVLKKGKLGIIGEMPIEMFQGFESEVSFIKTHYDKWKKVPDEATFINKFKDFTPVVALEKDEYLRSILMEENIYNKMVPIVQEVVEVMKEDSREAVSLLMQELDNLPKAKMVTSNDIISEANLRYREYIRTEDEDRNFIPTGIKELDTYLNGGLMRGEEFVVLFARISNGKSWMGIRFALGAWLQGFNVGLISPEMSAQQIGYRFDTMYKGFNNKDLLSKRKVPKYKEYIKTLRKEEVPFHVATMKDFSREITVTKIKNFVITNKLDFLVIDGITYLTDERKERGDNLTTTLKKISEDLMGLSEDLGIPVVVAVQANRDALRNKKNKLEDEEDVEEELPDLEHIKDSDGIAANASRCIALKMVGTTMHMQVRKNRHGVNGGKFVYSCDFNTGEFNYIPTQNDGVQESYRDNEISKLKEEFPDEGAL